MAGSLARRPLPALIALAALLVLTALVWWRVLHRSSAHATTAASSSCSSSSASPRVTLPGPGNITVQVLNATNRGGIAARARTTLVGDGFNIPSVAGNDKPKTKIAGVAEIRYGPKGRSGAALLRYYVPGAKIVHSGSKTAIVVLSLGDKYRGIASPTAVHSALTKHRVALATIAPTGSTSSRGTSGSAGSAGSSGSAGSPASSSPGPSC